MYISTIFCFRGYYRDLLLASLHILHGLFFFGFCVFLIGATMLTFVLFACVFVVFCRSALF